MRIHSIYARKTAVVLISVSGLLVVSEASAQDATWKAVPGNQFFDSNGNWTPLGIPTGVATFGASTITNLASTSDATLGGFTFNAGAPVYSFMFGTRTLTFTGAGIVNNSGSLPIFDFTGGQIRFFNASTAGNAKIAADFMFFGGTSNAGTADIKTLTTGLGGGITFDNSSSAASATIANNSTLQFKANASAGQAVLTDSAGATTVFRDSSTAANSTLITNSSILFLDTSSAGNATIVANAGGDVSFSNSSSGANARLVSNAGGVTNFYINAGGTAGSIEGAGNFNLSYYPLTVGSNNRSTEVSGQIVDGGDPAFPGSLIKVGAGTLALSGVNTYGGATVINGGTLAVNGSIAASSSVTVNAGGTLGGNGIVGNTTINGGTLAPGNSISLLTVQGSLTLTAAASYLVEVSPANADRVNVTGAANLGGATVNASFAAGAYITKQYTILSANGGLGGAFGSIVNTNLPSGFTSSLSYDANNVFLDLALNFKTPSGLNGNQQNVANALTKSFNANGGIATVFGSLAPAGLTQASGELAAGSQQTTFDAMGLFMGVMTDPYAAGRFNSFSNAASFASEGDVTHGAPGSRNARDAYAAIDGKAAEAFSRRWNVWAAGFGGSQTTDGNVVPGSNTVTSRVYGTAIGADYRLSPFTLAGFSLAGGGTNFSVANGQGSGRSDLFQAGAYMRHDVGAAYISAALAYGWQDITTDRTVTIAGVDLLRARFNANAWSGRLEGGYRLVSQGIGFTPYVAGQFATFQLPSYAEGVISGANTFALAYGAKDVTASRSELGLRTDKSFALKDSIFTLRGRAAWAHNFNTDRSVLATFQTLPGASFVTSGAGQAADAALATAAAEMKWLNGFSLAATFEGEFSSVTKSYAGKGVARYGW